VKLGENWAQKHPFFKETKCAFHIAAEMLTSHAVAVAAIFLSSVLPYACPQSSADSGGAVRVTTTTTTNPDFHNGAAGPGTVNVTAQHRPQQMCSKAPNLDQCPDDLECSKLDFATCFQCQCPSDCRYGDVIPVNCTVPQEVGCIGPRFLTINFTCQYCYQTEEVSEHRCEPQLDYCASVSHPKRQSYKASCSVLENVLCLGRRKFFKRKQCNWTAGYKWTTTLALSVTLGGFGADR